MSYTRSLAVALASTVWLYGCSSQVVSLYGYQKHDPAQALSVIDYRPEDEKTAGPLSSVFASCDYGILQIGDGQTVPSRLELLRSDLAQELDSQPFGKAILISRYAIHFNMRGELRRSEQAMADAKAHPRESAKEHAELRRYLKVGLIPYYFAGIGSFIADGFNYGLNKYLDFVGDECTKEETTAGWYEKSSVFSRVSPIVIEIEANVEGKQFKVQSLYSPAREFAHDYFADDFIKAAPEASRALYAAMQKANIELANKIRQRFGLNAVRSQKTPPAETNQEQSL